MELIKNTINICKTIAKGASQAMADGEVIVPDVKPDILKLLQVDAEACITDKFIENGRLVVCGRVDYKVLYVPDRENEKIKSIMTDMDFRQVVDAKGAGSEADITASVNVDRVEFNTVNSRKLRLRAVLTVSYELSEIVETEICSDILYEGAERKSKSMSFENTVNMSEHSFSLKERLEVPSGQRSIGELLKADVKISDTEYKTVTGKVIIKGNAGICILYTDEDGDIKYIETEVPFTEVFDVPGAGEDTVCDIDYSITGIMCEAEPDSDGDMRDVVIDVDMSAVIKGTDIEQIEVLEDCFIPYMNTQCECETVRINKTIERPKMQNTIREMIDFPNNLPNVSGVYNVMSNAVITKAEIERKKLICEGKLEVYVLYLTDSNENPIYSLKRDIKFSYMTDCETDIVPERIDIKAIVKHISYNLNGSGLELRCLLSIEGKLIKTEELDNIVDIEFDKKDKRSGIIIYFVKPGDVMWDVAKRYGVPQKKILKYNKLENEKLKVGDRLFIPR